MDKNVMLDHIETEVKLEGALSDEQRRRLIEIGEKCPVHRTLKSDIDISAKGVQSLR
jgi:putative redox protein